jgi:hypothetical protein
MATVVDHRQGQGDTLRWRLGGIENWGDPLVGFVKQGMAGKQEAV